jgi:diguanylate cyclase (GGDEF)-like protein/PAS domain S-box-containing protein
MSAPSDGEWQEMRRLVLGLGSASARKTHYPSLRQRVAELEQFRSMVDLSGDLLFVLNARSRVITDVNSTACRRLGMERDHLVGRPFSELLTPAGRGELDRVVGDFNHCLIGAQQFVSDLPSFDATPFPAEITVRCGASGGQDYAVLAARDITERRKAEVNLRRAAAFFSSTHEGVMVTDPDGNLVAVNPAFTAVTGFAEREVVGQNPRLLKSDYHDRDFFQTMWRDLLATGGWQGEIWNRRRNGEVFPGLLTISAVRDEEGRVANYVGVLADMTRLKNSETQLEFLVHHDALTGLPNRLLLMSRLDHVVERARRLVQCGALLFLDIDSFKTINDSLGPVAGDDLLKVVSRRMRQRLKEMDTLARLGGDEFAVLLEDIRGPAQAAEVARDLLAVLAAPVSLPESHEVYVTASIGISLFPDDGENALQLVQHADAALYRAKASGRNTHRFYTLELTHAANERLELEAALRRALEAGEFVVYYQPLVSMEERRILGVEALVRWNRAGGELVLPARFIPLTEETGLIVPLGEWVLREACRQMKAWLDEGMDLGTLAVNLSPTQFRQPDLRYRVEAALAETGLEARFLELEITEGSLMEEGRENDTTLAALKGAGVRIAVDDFGTGYSSLAYLKRLPLDKLKIDMSFVRDLPRDPADVAIVTTIIGMARNLGLEVVAEGVENPQQYEFLRDRGCDTGQGFLFSRPLPADELTAFLPTVRARGR